MIDHAHRYKIFLETLSPQTLNNLSEYVTEGVHFKDPFNDVTDIQSMERIFRDMFDTVENVKFTVLQIMQEQDRCLMEWRFEGRFRGKDWSFDGTSAIAFSEDGRVRSHIDYWDASSDFYQHLPIVGTLIRWIKKRVAVR